ncbi:unnamed protein product [Paramecium sonneborni]|uniref:Uncharacterized protein n=1 Tax=Paramecium sonneborni TaxID=65129 RepID=A0A8S1RY78_9CILI|nr:unnamed protein product [Paramecium sonneborni]
MCFLVIRKYQRTAFLYFNQMKMRIEKHLGYKISKMNSVSELINQCQNIPQEIKVGAQQIKNAKEYFGIINLTAKVGRQLACQIAIVIAVDGQLETYYTKITSEGMKQLAIIQGEIRNEMRFTRP